LRTAANRARGERNDDHRERNAEDPPGASHTPLYSNRGSAWIARCNDYSNKAST
jgi:hypothetical protein